MPAIPPPSEPPSHASLPAPRAGEAWRRPAAFVCLGLAGVGGLVVVALCATFGVLEQQSPPAPALVVIGVLATLVFTAISGVVSAIVRALCFARAETSPWLAAGGAVSLALVLASRIDATATLATGLLVVTAMIVLPLGLVSVLGAVSRR